MNKDVRSLILLVVLSTGFFHLVFAADEDELGCVRGDCENGSGVLIRITERGLTTYRGVFREGKYHGYGRLEYQDEGETYKGNWMMGKKQGRGTLWDKNNHVYIGQWRNDRRNGFGIQAFNVEGWVEDRNTENWLIENTENYNGEFRNDAFYGQGTYRWANGTIYVGSWAANKKHGEGYFDFGSGIRSNRIFEFDVQQDF